MCIILTTSPRILIENLSELGFKENDLFIYLFLIKRKHGFSMYLQRRGKDRETRLSCVEIEPPFATQGNCNIVVPSVPKCFRRSLKYTKLVSDGGIRVHVYYRYGHSSFGYCLRQGIK